MIKMCSLLVCLLLITAISSIKSSAQNLIVNADFTFGNTGFTSSYSNVSNPNPFGVKGSFDIVTNPKVWFTPFDACSDHTTGLGRMMVVDGSDINNTKLWEQTVTVVPGQTYQFSYYVQSVTIGSPARIEIVINGLSVGLPTTAPAATCIWAQRSYSWNSGASSSAIITIYDREISGGGNDFAIDDLSLTACPNPPVVTTPVYLCQNSPGFPLTAPALVGSTLLWYVAAVGGVGSVTAPTPSTTTVGATTFYVSQTDGICESPRAAIVVNVVADNGGTILGLTCDPSQIPFADRNTSVFFDWSNNVLISNNLYNYSYTIQGGPPVTGSRSVSNLPLIGLLLPGQSATLTLTAATFPCVPPRVITCTVPCGTTTTPNFSPISPFCTGTTAPILVPISPDGISGTWSPAIVSNTTNGSYIFTPNPLSFPCALPQTLVVTVDPLVTPAFTSIPVFVCQGAAAPILPLNSSNVTPITGTWSPATVNTTVLGSFLYTFTPNPGQCTAAMPTVVSIRIDPVVTPTFATVPAICSGGILLALPIISINGIIGTWSPALNNSATTLYTFTPTAGQCASPATTTIIVNPNITPAFTPVAAICSGTALAALPTISTNLITGTWSPAINNTATTTYTFTPTAGQCATVATLTITVNPNVIPLFAPVPAICSGAILSPLPTTSTNGISGTWSPALNNTVATLYTFTPTVGLCATLTTLTIAVNPIIVPNFATIPNVCSGSTAPILATTSPNGIIGTWSPTIISNTASGSYTFTPALGQCSISQILNVIVTPTLVTNFTTIPAFCAGTVAPILAPISPNGVNGTWLPATISNTTSGSYVFTPNATECATSQTLSVVVNPIITPDFNDLSICSGATAPILATISTNGITGTWAPSSIDNNSSGTYVFTPNAPQCATLKTINVTVNPSNTLISFSWTVSEAFSKNQIVSVIATAAGNYLYQLDSGPFQTSAVFENVSSGLHSITVIEVNGCSAPITDNNVLVIGYPKFFTPNGDGYNDVWNISSLNNQLNTRIYIFDRYGKLLKDISPNDSGWDGTYIGRLMPAGDYWFTVDYVELNIIKKFKSHFSLKR